MCSNHLEEHFHIVRKMTCFGLSVIVIQILYIIQRVTLRIPIDTNGTVYIIRNTEGYPIDLLRFVTDNLRNFEVTVAMGKSWRGSSSDIDAMLNSHSTRTGFPALCLITTHSQFRELC